MKDKILKAIDNGLMKVLSTDISDQDIDFNHDDINAKADLSFVIKEMVDTLHKQDIGFSDTVTKIIELYQNTGTRYTVKNYYELLNISRKLEITRLANKVKYDNLYSWIDFSESFNITVLNSNFTESDITQISENSMMVKISMDILKENTIIIHKNALQDKPIHMLNRAMHRYKESSDYKYEDAARHDTNGFRNTNGIRNGIMDICPGKRITSVSEVFAYLKKVPVKHAEPYIPSAGQMSIILELKPIIKWCMSKMGVYFNLDDSQWWTSTECNNGKGIAPYVWYVDEKDEDILRFHSEPTLRTCDISDQKNLLPIYKVKK